MTAFVRLRDRARMKTASTDVQAIAEASVRVETAGSTGSGTVIAHVGRSSWVLSCAHVAGPGASAQVVWRVGKRFVRARGKVERADSARDLSLIRTRRLPLPALALAVEEPDLYEKLWVVAAPEGYHGTAVESVLSGKDGSNGDPDEAYQLSGFSAPGASGGTVANFNGELVGVVTGIRHDGHRPLNNIVFASPLPAIKAFLSEGKAFADAAARKRKRAGK